MSEVLIALVTTSTVTLFIALWGRWFVEADGVIVGVLWGVPAFLVSMGFAALTLGVFYPAVKVVAAIVT